MIGMAFIGVGLGIGLVVLGAGLGIGRIGDGAAQGISRQPEASGVIQLAMIITAALIEGVALFGLVIAFLMSNELKKDTILEFAKTAPAAVEQAKAPVK